VQLCGVQCVTVEPFVILDDEAKACRTTVAFRRIVVLEVDHPALGSV
jgi:hypothetical protein